VRRFAIALVVTLALGWAIQRAREGPAAPQEKAPDVPLEKPSPAPDPSAEAVRNDCLACHTEDLIRQQRLTDKQWAKSVEKMRGWGAPTEPAGADPLTAYLASTYTQRSGPYSQEIISAQAAGALFAALPDGPLAGGDAQRGMELYRERCSACHEESGRGGAEGVNLVREHILDRAADFAKIVRQGRGRMPGYEETTDAEAGDLLAYLRSLR